MPFNIEAQPTFTRTVAVSSPDGETGDFQATFVAMPISRFQQVDWSDGEQTRAFLSEALIDVADLVGNDGHPVSFTPGVKTKLLDMSWVRTSIFEAYLAGIDQASRKN